LFRQWFYLKFCFPGTWILGGILCHLHAALVLFAGSRCVAAMLGYVQAPKGLSATLFLLLLTAMGFLLRRIHSQPGPWLPWLAACYANFFMASWSHLCTIFSSEIPWRGIRYRVTRGGRVTAITEE
jgi:hypothetical protein